MRALLQCPLVAAVRVLACALLAALAAGCGAGAPSGRLSAEVVQQADERCAEANQALEEVDWPGEERLSLETAAPAIADTAAVHTDLLADLAGLPVEPGERAALDELTGAAQPILGLLGDMEEAARTGDAAAFAQTLGAVEDQAETAAAVSESLGLSACYRPPA
jgi:hypothetical protein